MAVGLVGWMWVGYRWLHVALNWHSLLQGRVYSSQDMYGTRSTCDRLHSGGGGLRTGPSPVGELTPMCPVLAGVLLLRRLYKHALLLPLEAPSLPGCMPSG